jgi:hypothetical protein
MTVDTKTYRVAHRTPLDTVAVPAGLIAVDAELQVKIIEAEPAFAEQLAQAARTMNGRSDFLLHADPKDRKTRAITKRLVPRDSAEAPGALLEALRQSYGFELTLAG